MAKPAPECVVGFKVGQAHRAGSKWECLPSFAADATSEISRSAILNDQAALLGTSSSLSIDSIPRFGQQMSRDRIIAYSPSAYCLADTSLALALTWHCIKVRQTPLNF